MRYSRLQSVEEKRNMRSAVFLIILSLLGLLALYIFGVPLAGKLTVLVSSIGKSNKPITSTDHTPPAPPSFNPFSNFTNNQNFNLTGTAEAGSTVKLTFNGSEQDTLASKDGQFSFNLTLTNGDNTFNAVAVDTAGNISQPTPISDVTFDNKPPSLNINSPSDGSQFFGSEQMQQTFKGTTDSGNLITINGRIIAVDDTGNFQYTTTLQNGDNKFAVIATDKAGNTTEKDITLSFSQ